MHQQLLCGVAHLLNGHRKKVLAVNLGAIMAGTLFQSERETLLVSLLREAREAGIILALEQAEWAMIGVPRSQILLREALDKGTRLIATAAGEHERRFAISPLGSRLEIVRLTELCASDTCQHSMRHGATSHNSITSTVELLRV